MKPVSEIVPKEMIPILGRPFLYYVLRKIAQAKIRSIIIVTSEWKLPIIQNLDSSQLGIKIEYVVQKEPLGPAQAMLEASSYIDTEHMMVYYGDNLADGNVPLELIHALHENQRVDAVISLREVDDTSRYGVARFDANRVVEIVEKPAPGREPSKFAAMGVYIMKTESFFQSLNGITFEYGKEQFPPQYIIRAGGQVASWVFKGRWVDMGKPVDMLRASALISKGQIKCVVLKADSTIYGGFPTPSEGVHGAPERNDLMNGVRELMSGMGVRDGFVISSRRKELVQTDLASYGLQRFTYVRPSKGGGATSSINASEGALDAFKPSQVLVIGGDYENDLMNPARRGMHVLLLRGKEDLAALKDMYQWGA